MWYWVLKALFRPIDKELIALALFAVAMCCVTGCSDKIAPPSTSQIVEFESAAPDGPTVDLNQVAKAKLRSGPYRVVAGDVLQVEMPRILDAQTLGTPAPADGRETYTCRVSDAGTIILPVVGSLTVAGKSLAEVEAYVVGSYHPKFVKTKPPVYVAVLEHKKQRVSVMGAVARSGIYSLRHDQMTLVGLLMEAGGIVDEGAAVIRINRHNQNPREHRTLSRSSRLQRPTGADSPGCSVARLSVPMEGQMPAEAAGREKQPAVLFLPEGPLNTTGWLVLARGEETTRKWLDLDSELQRRDFLGTAAPEMDSLARAELRGRLSVLAEFLNTHPAREKALPSPHASVWTMTDDGWFVTALAGQVTQDRQVARAAMEQTIGGAQAAAEDVASIVLPVRGLSIPFADVVLQEGDSVVVEPPPQQFVSVIGLVNRPGNFPYPFDVRYTLIQAVALAGGFDLTADPRYVSVYRLKADGGVAAMTVQLVDPEAQEQLTEELALPLKPGEIVSVEHTPRTRTNTFLDRIFRVSLGLYFRPESFWEDDD